MGILSLRGTSIQLIKKQQDYLREMELRHSSMPSYMELVMLRLVPLQVVEVKKEPYLSPDFLRRLQVLDYWWLM